MESVPGKLSARELRMIKLGLFYTLRRLHSFGISDYEISALLVELQVFPGGEDDLGCQGSSQSHLSQTKDSLYL